MGGDREPERPTITLMQARNQAVALQIRTFRIDVVQGQPADLGKRHHGRARTVLIGSHPSADVALTDPYVSRLHARLEVREAGFFLVDTGSRNGTRVNGVRIGEVCLENGFHIDLGATRLKFALTSGTFEIPLGNENRFEGLIGRSVAMREVFALLARFAPTSAPVLIEGETGTGKELVARAIHARSNRSLGPFVVFDCAAVPPSLIESEILGVDQGAFTGATSARAGAVERAHNGTLFLDELGELRLDVQAKLLRVLEAGQVMRLGAEQPKKVDVRFVAATNRELERMACQGQFRDDLYYRLAVLRLRLPALRERREDVPLLAAHFAQSSLGAALSHVSLSGLEIVLEQLRDYHFPGNVRELKNLVERAAILADPDALRASAQQAAVELARAVTQCAGKAVSWRLSRKEHDRAYLIDLLKRTSGDLALAANIAELHPKSFERLLRQHGLRG
jgi:DNA-binding NtrC family response regulator